MKAFTDLCTALDRTTKTTVKVAALSAYFAAAPPGDAAWAVYFLTGRKLPQVVPTRRLAGWAIETAGIPPWLFEESYHAVGDLAETIALVLPDSGEESSRPLADWVEHALLPLRDAPEYAQRQALLNAWSAMSPAQRFVWNKLITGQFRVGVSQQLVIRALAAVVGVEEAVVAHRLMGEWQPTHAFFESLRSPPSGEAAVSRPYPFFLASPIEGDAVSPGDRADWQAEWKWDGIRSQLIRRAGQTFLWSRGEELVTDRYPEIIAAARSLPDGVVIDGEILPWKGTVQPFSALQRRIGRKALGKKILADVPVVLMAYDLLESDGVDLREQPLSHRRDALERIVAALPADSTIRLSPVQVGSWDELAELRESSRAEGVEGLMLKRLSSPYRVGRVRGDWWKWKIHPFTIDAVLINAQRGSGKRASLYTDYTFGLWDGDELVPVAKAYSGLTDEEIGKVDAFIRRNTAEKFGPVRSVKPELVFELAFEGISRSTRHRSGVAVRFPRILRWRHDKKPADADTLDALQRLIPAPPPPPEPEPDLFSGLIGRALPAG